MTVRFVVEDVFDIASRGGVILSGTLDGGHITTGMVLHDVQGRNVRVIGIEFHTKPGKHAVIVDRAGYVPRAAGEVLTASISES